MTQVVSGRPELLLHNRLTHSLKVEQVGLSIASYLGHDSELPYDGAAVATACLGHDIGHPPFGHACEAELDRLLVCKNHKEHPRKFEDRIKSPCKTCLLEDGFEGNAQSFRVLTALAVHRSSRIEPFGLDLTRASLQAVSKYPWLRNNGSKRSKWGAYDCDASTLDWAFGQDHDGSLALTAQMMDWADDISYAVHDIEDFFRIGLIPLWEYYSPKGQAEGLARLLKYASEQPHVGKVDDETILALKNHFIHLPRYQFRGRTRDFVAIDKFRNHFLDQFISLSKVENGNFSDPPLARKTIDVLKQLTWFHVIDSPRLYAIQQGQRRVIREIFHDLHERAIEAFNVKGDLSNRKRDRNILDPMLRRAVKMGRQQKQRYGSPYSEEQVVTRAVVDYIAGLSDLDAYKLHSTLKGREGYGNIL